MIAGLEDRKAIEFPGLREVDHRHKTFVAARAITRRPAILPSDAQVFAHERFVDHRPQLIVTPDVIAILRDA